MACRSLLLAASTPLIACSGCILAPPISQAQITPQVADSTEMLSLSTDPPAAEALATPGRAATGGEDEEASCVSTTVPDGRYQLADPQGVPEQLIGVLVVDGCLQPLSPPPRDQSGVETVQVQASGGALMVALDSMKRCYEAIEAEFTPTADGIHGQVTLNSKCGAPYSDLAEGMLIPSPPR